MSIEDDLAIDDLMERVAALEHDVILLNKAASMSSAHKVIGGDCKPKEAPVLLVMQEPDA